MGTLPEVVVAACCVQRRSPGGEVGVPVGLNRGDFCGSPLSSSDPSPPDSLASTREKCLYLNSKTSSCRCYWSFAKAPPAAATPLRFLQNYCRESWGAQCWGRGATFGRPNSPSGDWAAAESATSPPPLHHFWPIFCLSS